MNCICNGMAQILINSRIVSNIIMKKEMVKCEFIKSIYKQVCICAFYIVLFLSCNNDSKEFGVVILDKRPVHNTKVNQHLVYWQEVWVDPRPVVFHFIKLNLQSHYYELFTIIGEDPDGDGPAEAQLESPVQLVVKNQALAAVNANAFRHISGTSDDEKKRGWYVNKAVDIAGLAVNNRIIRSDTEKSRIDFWIDLDNIPYIGKITNPDSVKTAVSDWGSNLLEDGEIVPIQSNIQHPRTMLGFDKEKRFIILVVADGRQEGYSEGISLYEAAGVMKEHGCYEAVNLDGGGSSIMLARKLSEGGGMNQVQIMNSPSGGIRAIPVMLAIRKLKIEN